MTTYNTMNPVPSSDARDRYDNSQVFDEYVTGNDFQTPDRQGKSRKTWAGIENDFSDFLLSMGFETEHLTYVDGTPLNVDRPTQLIDRNGLVYRVKLPANFPLALTGEWALDSLKLLDVGDLSLRLELADDGGAGMVGIRRFPSSNESTVERVLKRNSPANVFDYMTEAEIADALSYAPVLDHTASIQAALNNHATVEFGLGAFRFSQLVMPLFDQSLIGRNSGNQLYGQTTVFVGFDTTKDFMVWAQKPEWRFEGIVFSGMADGAERGEGTIQNGIKAVGTTQKDLDGSIKQCGFIKMRSAVVANGTNIRFDDVIFSGVKYGLEVTVSGGWQNRGFIFSPSCRFHGCGKTNVSSACVFAQSSTNTIDVEINGCFVDDSTSVFLGFSQGLKIADVTNTRARGTSISLETSGLAPVSSFKRAVNISDFRHESHNVINAAYPVSGLIAVGEMELVVNGFHVDGSGGHGINSTVSGATFDNIVISDAGQFAASSYDGLSTSGANVKIGQVVILSKQNYIKPVNTVRYGVRASAGPVTFGGRISGVGPMTELYVIASTVVFSGDLPPNDTTLGVSRTYGSAMPVSGTYGKGSFVENLLPTLIGTSPNQYTIAGWRRLTTGSAHVLGTDWVAMRTLTGT